MNRELLAMEIKTLLVSSLGLSLDPCAIDEDESLLGSRLHLASLTAIEILTALEDRFGVQFPDEMIDRSLFMSVRRLVDAVSALLYDSAQAKTHADAEHR